MHRVQMTKANNRLAEENRKLRQVMVNNVAKHLQFIIPFVLYEYMDFSFKKLDNCITKMYEVKELWEQDDTSHTTESLLTFCNDKKINVVAFVRSIPQNEKLFLADTKKGCLNGLNAVDSAMLHCFLLILPILKTNYRMSNAKIDEFFYWSKHIIKLYSEKMPKESGYVFSDKYIRDIFLEDLGFDMYTREFVNAK